MTEKVQGFSSNSVQVLIEGKPTSVLKLNDTTTNVYFIFQISNFKLLKFKQQLKKKTQTVISNSFGIRCPSSIKSYPTTSTFLAFDYESSSCQWDNMPANSAAFCGKCALKNNAQLFSNTANSSLTYNYVK